MYVGLMHSISRLGQRWFGNHRVDDPHTSAHRLRICRFEECEPRQLMAADLHVGAVYYEPASGDDAQPNIIQISFQGGAPGTQLTRIVIDGNKDGNGLSSGDVFFDTVKGGLGSFGANPLKIVSHDGFQVVSTEVVDGGTQLVINLSGFEAGETLVLSVDVDEAQYVNGSTIDTNAVVEGGEFQRSHFDTTFVAEHYEDTTLQTLFWDDYDGKFAAADAASKSRLNLPPDQYSSTTDLSDFTAGAVAVGPQKAKPSSLAGVVYVDANLNNHQDGADAGIGGVTLALYSLDATNNYVPTGKTTVTDAQGHYKFDKLEPGIYRVVETQPLGYFSVGASPGTVNGQTRGTVTTVDILSGLELLGGEDSVENDFSEALPNSIKGHVGLAVEGLCGTDLTPPIADVTVNLLDSNGNILRTTKTDANGNYIFQNLAPGTYGIQEIQPVGYFDAATHAGSAGGDASNNLITHIVLLSDIKATDYDFCELLPASISGYVYVDANNNGIKEPGELPIAGVTIALRDANGLPTGATTTTDASGFYRFNGLRPGTYGVSEVQPAGYYDGLDTAGTASGTAHNPGDLITGAILTSGLDALNYNFGELAPASLSGYVYSDLNNNGVKDPGELGIAGTVLKLLDANGQPTGATTTTDANGFYHFDNLQPGTYGVSELQPNGYLDGIDHAGSAGGIAHNPGDSITGAVLTSGVNGQHYDFGELLPAELCGFVYSDLNNNGVKDPGEAGIAGVTLKLLNANGQPTGASIVTGEDGEYCFVNLPPGSYSVTEIQPTGYFDGIDTPGTAGGVAHNPGDLISGIVLTPGVHAEDNNFGELLPAKLCGYVYADLNNNGLKDAGEAGIPGVKLILLNANGQPTGASVTTGDDGHYCFDDLPPGTYGITETQPPGYFDGIDTPGTAGGVAQNPGDLISNIVLTSGVHSDFNNFGELPPASITGRVDGRYGNTCDIEKGATPLQGVTIHLVNSQGVIIATTKTNSTGDYYFGNIAPGTYSILEEQPVGYFEGDSDVGSEGGQAVNGSLIGSINLKPGAQGISYDFCEITPTQISGYVFQDGPPIEVKNQGDVPDVLALRDGKLTPDDTRLAGVTLQLRDGVTGQPLFGSMALPGTYPANSPITTVTDSQGYYVFRGLPPGVYAVYDVTPEGYLPGIDTVGSQGGNLVSYLIVTDPAAAAALTDQPTSDAIIGVKLLAAYESVGNNFSVVRTFVTPEIPVIFPPAPPAQPAAVAAVIAEPGPPLIAPVVNAVQYLVSPALTRTGGALYTWHLSVVDAGMPRGPVARDPVVQLTSVRAGDEILWRDGDLDEGDWTLAEEIAEDGTIKVRKSRFGMKGAIPVTGDFNGDGTTDFGLFKDGEWFIDLNNNGQWDAGDLWAKLGHHGDKPVTGDWDGDGKTDIGIYGPAWSGDPRAIANEPGLPDSHNERVGAHKNLPRAPEKTAIGNRTMKLTATGKPRADLIDHVFLYGRPGDRPVVGDWNGDGTATIAVFRDGVWHRDIDGDGQWSKAERRSGFGQIGDLPVVGDFNGDGVDELGVYRDGKWYIDTNGNGVLDGDDQTFELGGPGDVPVVGDWNGDGKAEPGVYHEKAASPSMPLAQE